MNQVEIQNDNLGPTIDQTEDMHMEKAKSISVQEDTFNNYVTTHNEQRLDDLLFMD
jgi:beta-glucanase (GH16 family)